MINLFSHSGPKLSQLVGGLSLSKKCTSTAIKGITLDSRELIAGDLFIALKGSELDGAKFVPEAVKRGAVAVLFETGIGDSDTTINKAKSTIPIIGVENLSQHVSTIASRFYGNPSRRLGIMGVTGTNGKTTCCQLYADLLSQLNASSSDSSASNACGYIGTLGHGVSGSVDANYDGSEKGSVIGKAPLTTPDAITMQKLLDDLEKRGCSDVAIEVSSHSLAQHRVAAVKINTAIFTNLSRDHLDYHGDFDSYAAAKASLFKLPGLKNAVINIDDNVGKAILADLDPSMRGISFSLENITADIHCQSMHLRPDGLHAVIQTPWGSGEVKSSLLGKFNLSNLLAVIGAIALHEGDLGHQKFQKILTLVPQLKAVIGRMELVSDSTDLAVIVDYAHTPDALQEALQALRLHCEGKLWVVFGCGGDRDTGKRPAMGAIAVKYADHVIVTSDNPRTESANRIIDQIVQNIKGQCSIESDRRAAIKQAVLNAKPSDVVLIAGKGHENYQILGVDRLAFSDQTEARLALDQRLPLHNLGDDS
ncbi:MAG TPA: UDP-N-acetylmuramoyl-L-alanyl-D-glutamate--2,6-diaminopimelate ligase [Porticoccaceae bacterium]|nr:UDP-N-acetylmuramoyl-L-alanyl-D-glutamate--2,6-diaminopimelate ligase [Porticoccaceae bacterium]